MSATMARYALYYAPRADEALANAASQWLGWNPEGGRARRLLFSSGFSPERLVEIMGLQRGPAVLVGEGLKVPALLRLAARARCRPAKTLLEPLRAIKDAHELRMLEEAASNADRVIEQTADFVQPGRTEVEIEGFVFERFAALGDSETWAIVASGPHSALPHHHSGS